MAPKKGSKKLPQQIVTPEALQKAKELLADESEKKRQRSSMSYQLDQQGVRAKYGSLGKKAKVAYQIW